jgi:glucokinase
MDIALAIDIGGTKFSVGLVTRNGELIDRVNVPVDHGGSADELFEDLEQAVVKQLDRAKEHHGVNPSVVGVACAGPIQRNVETVSPLNILQWRQFPLRQRLADITGLPVFGSHLPKAG